MSGPWPEGEDAREADSASNEGSRGGAGGSAGSSAEDESTPRPDDVPPSAEDDSRTGDTAPARESAHGEEDSASDQDGSDGEDTDGPSFAVLDGEMVIKHWEVFVEPPGWNPGAVKGSRVILLSGDERSGKFTAALNLLPPSSDLGWLVYTRRDPLPLLASACHPKWPLSSVVLLENAFENGIRETDLKSTALALLQERLEDRNSTLILTTTSRTEDLRSLEVSKLSLARTDLQKVFEKHIAWYVSCGLIEPQLGTEVSGLWEKLAPTLPYPGQIDQYCKLLGRDRPVGAAACIKLAASPEILRRDLRAWFEALSEEARYFAILAAVFQKAERAQLGRIFSESVYSLRKERCDFLPDPRKVNLVTLAETVHLRGEVSLEFDESSVLKEAVRQAQGRIEILGPVVVAAIERTRNKEPDFWRRRWIFAAALGRIGLCDPGRYRQLLFELAGARDHQGNGVAALAASALAETVATGGASGREFVRKTLWEWTKSEDPHQLWTAAAALARVFAANERGAVSFGDNEGTEHRDRFREDLGRLLGSLGLRSEHARFSRLGEAPRGSSSEREAASKFRKLRFDFRNATADAIGRVGNLDLGLVIGQFRFWLQEVETPPLRTVDLGLQQLMGFIEKRGVDAFEGDTGKHLVQLVELILLSRLPIGAQGFRKLLRCLLAACDQSAIRELATRRLLEVIHMGPSRVRQRLRSSFAGVEWGLWGDKVATLHRTVMTRSAALDGLLVDRPGRGRCLLVIDPDFLGCSGAEPRKRAEEIERRQQAFRQVVRTLSAHLELWTVELGERTAHGPEPTSIRDPNEIGVYRRPRLVLPAVESMDCGSLRLIVVLGVGRITDLEDLGEAGLADRVLLVSVGDAWDAVEGVDTLTLPATLEAEKLGELDLRIVEYWARWVVEAGRADWEPVLRSLGVDPAALANRRWFEEAAAQLADPSSVRGYPDVSRQYLVALFWLASEDLQVALDHLVAWLGPEVKPQDFRCALALAGARAMFRAYSASPRTAIGGVPQRLFEELADPLARTGSDGIETILEAVEKWLRNSDLVEFFAGDPVRGRGRLIRWADRFAPHRVEAFGKFLRRVESRLRTTWVEESPEAEIADQLRASCAAGPVRPWPELGEGERMAVVIVDASDDRVLQSELAPRAAEFCHRLDRPGLRPALIRMGEKYPVWVAGDSWANSSLVAIQARSNSRLIGPILESLTPEQTALVLLIGRHPPIDGEDLLEGPWGARLLALAPLIERGWHGAIPSFPRIRSGHNEIAAFWTVLTDHFGLTEVEVR